MDKNTILAIVLSAIVLFGYFFFDAFYMAPKREAAYEARQAAELEEQAAKAAEAEQLSSKVTESPSMAVFADGEDAAGQEAVSVQEFTITTNRASVVLTNRGGDIVSYKLTEHLDKDTGEGVQMVDNVTSSNHAFGLSFGDSAMAMIDGVFNVKRIDDYTIGFYRDFTMKGDDGVDHKFRLGKLYSFTPDDYAFRLSVTVNGLDGSAANLDLGGAAYTLRTPPQIGPHYDRKSNRYEVRQFVSWDGRKKQKKVFSDRSYDKPWEWAGAAGKYFAVIVKPADNTTMSSAIRCSSEQVSGYENSQVFVTRSAIHAGNTTDEFYIYVGPRSEKELLKYNSADSNGWKLVNARFNQALQTSGFLSIIEVALKWCLENIYRLVHNWGVAIIILTIFLKIVLFPLNKSTALGSIKMQGLQPKMKEIQEKYKDDPQQQQAAMGKLYKEAGYNPASGCLPMVLQMMVLFALYNVFNNHFEFRGASFIHGWIDDLSVGDSLFSWKQQIPFISQFTMNTFRLLPFIYTGSQLLNGLITQYGNAAGANQSSMKFMMYGMPLMFFFLFYNVPSGLLLYWTVSNVLQIGQQMIINKIMAKKRAELEASKPRVIDKAMGGKKKKKGRR
ncbi:MAG: membrane protein insertase YidC [Treponema sp.]|nr:membrane protein insertase YidC [Treponema sp.]